MKRCPSCQNEIVLDAAHCPHCGAKQDARTVLGFAGGPSADDVRVAVAIAAPPRPPPPPPPPAAGLEAALRAPLAELSMPSVSLDGSDGAPEGSIGPAPEDAGPPASAFGPPGYHDDPPAHAPPAPPAALPVERAWAGPAATGPSASWRPGSVASSVPVRHGGTAVAHEAGAGGLRGVSVVFGLIVLATVLGPQAFPEDGSVTWGASMLESALDGGGATVQGAFAAAGALALLFGLVPVPHIVRAVVATLAGLGPVITAIVIQGSFLPAGSPDAQVHAYLALAAFFVLPAGLLLRANHWPSMAGRIVATIGGLLYVAVVTVPMRGAMPIVTAVEALSTDRMLFVALAIFAVLLLGLLAFLAWLPARLGAGAGWIAWVELAAPPLATLGLVAKETEELAQIARAPAATVFPAIWLLALGAFAAYGLAGVIGRLDAWRA